MGMPCAAPANGAGFRLDWTTNDGKKFPSLETRGRCERRFLALNDSKQARCAALCAGAFEHGFVFGAEEKGILPECGLQLMKPGRLRVEFCKERALHPV